LPSTINGNGRHTGSAFLSAPHATARLHAIATLHAAIERDALFDPPRARGNGQAANFISEG